MAAAAADMQPRCMRLFEDHSIISCHVPGQGASEREDFCLMCSKRAYGYNEHIGSTVHQKNLRNWWSSESGQTRVQKLKWIFQSKEGPCEKHGGYVAKDISKQVRRHLKEDQTGTWMRARQQAEKPSLSSDEGDWVLGAPDGSAAWDLVNSTVLPSASSVSASSAGGNSLVMVDIHGLTHQLEALQVGYDVMSTRMAVLENWAAGCDGSFAHRNWYEPEGKHGQGKGKDGRGGQGRWQGGQGRWTRTVDQDNGSNSKGAGGKVGKDNCSNLKGEGKVGKDDGSKGEGRVGKDDGKKGVDKAGKGDGKNGEGKVGKAELHHVWGLISDGGQQETIRESLVFDLIHQPTDGNGDAA